MEHRTEGEDVRSLVDTFALRLLWAGGHRLRGTFSEMAGALVLSAVLLLGGVVAVYVYLESPNVATVWGEDPRSSMDELS